MAAVDWFAHAEVAEPPVTTPRRRKPPARRPAASVRSRRKPTQRRIRGHIVWMTLFAILLFGVVAVNVAVLRAHVAVSKLQDERARIAAHNQALASALSAANSAPRIEAAAHRLNLVQASAGSMSYVDLTPHGR
jgi:hypothetical protein